MSRDGREIAPVREKLEKLNKLRRRAAHRELNGEPLDKEDAEEVRRFAYEIIERVVK
jgi:hypothetical protein